MTNNISSIKTLIWNANSLRNKLFIFYDLLRSNDIKIACVSETLLTPDDVLHRDADYVLHRLDRDTDSNQRGGGVLIAIHRSIKHKLLPQPRTKLLEAISVEIALNNNNKVKFTSVYLPGGASTSQINQHYKNDIRTLTSSSSQFFIGGDLNSKHRLWNCVRANRAGHILHQEHYHRDFMILHPNEPSYYPPVAGQSPSTIDLVLTNTTYDISELEAQPSCSDHCYVTFAINLSESVTLNERSFVPCYRLADWDKYRDLVSIELHARPFPQLDEIRTTEQIDEMVEFFSSSLLKAQQRVVPLMQRKKYSLILPHCIKNLIAEKHCLVRRIQRNPGMRQLLKPRQEYLTATIAEEINKIRNQNFNHMISKISNDDQHRSLFQTAKFIKNRHQQIPPLKTDDSTLITAPEKASEFANQFKQNHENPLANDNRAHTTFIDRSVNRFLQRCEPPRDSIELSNTMEIREICGKLRNRKAPGQDRIRNNLLKQMSTHGFQYLTLIVNACLRLKYFPRRWRHAQVIPIKKPQKPSARASSYRPISLLSAISKILERVTLTRLRQHLDDNDIIPEFQHGFRSERSTVTQLMNVTGKIKQGLQTRQSTGMILIDIEKAFDRVWHNGLLFKLIQIRTPQYLIKLISSFLSNRSFCVKVNDTMSPETNINFGVPQGAVLSPTLYNIYTYDAPVLEDCEVAQFADDTAFLRTSRFAKTIVRGLEKSFRNYQRYYKLWKIKVNNTKTRAVFFSKRRTRQLPRVPFKAGDANIEWSNEAKYLGLILDRRLTYRHHINYAVDKTLKAMRILYSLLNRKSKLDNKNKNLLFKVCLRPIMTYASPIISQAAKTHISKLQVVQNKILRMILDAPWRTRVSSMHEELQIETITEFISRLRDSYHTRVVV